MSSKEEEVEDTVQADVQSDSPKQNAPAKAFII